MNEIYRTEQKVIFKTDIPPLDWLIVQVAKLWPGGWEQNTTNFAFKEGAEMVGEREAQGLEKSPHLKVVRRTRRVK